MPTRAFEGSRGEVVVDIDTDRSGQVTELEPVVRVTTRHPANVGEHQVGDIA